MPSSRPTRLAVVLGALAILAIPLGAVAAVFLGSVEILRATIVTAPVAVVLGLAAVGASRRARYALERTVRRPGERIVRTSRVLAWGGVYLGVTGLLALAFYGVLKATS